MDVIPLTDAVVAEVMNWAGDLVASDITMAAGEGGRPAAFVSASRGGGFLVAELVAFDPSSPDASKAVRFLLMYLTGIATGERRIVLVPNTTMPPGVMEQCRYVRTAPSWMYNPFDPGPEVRPPKRKAKPSARAKKRPRSSAGVRKGKKAPTEAPDPEKPAVGAGGD